MEKQLADRVFQLPRLPSALLASLAVLFPLGVAQYPPPPEYSDILQSPLDPDITISYKQPPNGTCMTAFANQTQYTGYIHIPPYTLVPVQQNYSINTFFWFVEARQSPDTAPLTVWLSGGPGASSMFGFFNEVGPCEVVQMQDGSYGTRVREWGWDRSSNVLFIDQPNQVGFSYDRASNGSFDLFNGDVFSASATPNKTLPDFMYVDGTFGTGTEQDRTPWAATANTTDTAARATWHFLQAWLSTFPQYDPARRPDETTEEGDAAAGDTGVHLFVESYGGKYGPTFATYFDEQNKRRLNGSLPADTTLAIRLESLGILNGMIDDLIQASYFPAFAANNTYGINAISQTDWVNDKSYYISDCEPWIRECRDAMAADDPEGYGDDAGTNTLCKEAQLKCAELQRKYVESGRYIYDIRQELPSPDPPAAYQEYLNNDTVLAAIGARVNYTESNPYVLDGFVSTGDTIRGGQLQDLAYLLTTGVRVALIYGDADYVCNWYGGQAASLAIAALLPDYPPQLASTAATAAKSSAAPSYALGFPAAGYADIVINSTTVAGATRQYGNLTFSRIYSAGHFVPYFQPEAAFTVFTRIIQGTYLSTGDIIDLSSFASPGPANASYSESPPSSSNDDPTCWLRAWNQSCSTSDTTALLAGKGGVAHGVFSRHASDLRVVDDADADADADAWAGRADGTSALTGVYTATGTPRSEAAVAWPRGAPHGARAAWTPVAVVLVGVAVGAMLL